MKADLLKELKEFKRYLIIENDARIQFAHKETVATRKEMSKRGVHFMSPVIPNLIQYDLESFTEWLEKQVASPVAPLKKGKE